MVFPRDFDGLARAMQYQSPEGDRTMTLRSFRIVVAAMIGVSIVAPIVSAEDIRQDRREIRSDRQQLRSDLKAGDAAAVRQDRKDLRADRRELRRDRREIRESHAGGATTR
jgi:hypothetical protein